MSDPLAWTATVALPSEMVETAMCEEEAPPALAEAAVVVVAVGVVGLANRLSDVID
jgi:hypothetical protein